MSALNWKLNAQLFTALTSTSTVIGIYQGADGTKNSLVSFGTYLDNNNTAVQSIVSVGSSTRYRPTQGEPVILTWTNGQLLLSGPAQTKSSDGKIVSVSNPTAVVTCDGSNYTLPFAVSIADQLAAGNPVAIDWDYKGGYIKDIISTAPTPDANAPKLTSDQKPFTLNFFAKQSGSKHTVNPPGAAPSVTSWWTQDVRATDDDTVGAWFYGNVIRNSLRDDAYISSVEVYMPLRSASGGLPKIGRHTQDKRPGNSGTLSVEDADTRGARKGWVSLPVEWAQTWRANAGGVAVQHGGKNIYKGIQADRQSGKLRIRGRQ